MASKFFTAMLKSEKNQLASTAKVKERIVMPSPSLNWALSGGLYMGYTTCFYGPEGSGKSLLSMMAIGALHQADPKAEAVLISTEMRTPSPERLRALGVDPDRLITRQVNTLHDVFDWISSRDEKFENSDGTKDGPGLLYGLETLSAPIKALVIDSVKGIRGPKEQALQTVEKDYMGDLSKYLNPALKGILEIIRKYQLMTILIQQVNMNLNADEVKYQNKKWVIPSGQSLKHFCETMALVERVEKKDAKIFDDNKTLLKGDKSMLQLGHTIRVRVDKANLDNPFREAEFKIDYNRGVVSTGQELANLAKSLGVINHPENKETGKEIATQWVFGGKKWIGWDNAVEEILSSPELQEQIMAEILGLDKKVTDEAAAG